MTLAKRLRGEALYWDGLFLATVLWILFGALPILAILVIALVTGTIPIEGEPPPPGFPAFSPPWWGLYLLTAELAVLAIGSLALPLRGARSFSRGSLAILLFLTMGTTVFALGMVGVVEKSFRGLDILLSVQGILFALTLVRMLLGSLRLVPQKWREYVDDDGRVIPPNELVRPPNRRPWSGELPSRKARK